MIYWNPEHWIQFFPLILFFNLFFYWRIIALQNFVFCQNSTWISHRYTYIPSLLNLLPISSPIQPLQIDTEPLFEFPEPYSKFLLAIHLTYSNVSFHVTLSIHLTLSSPLPMSISLFSMSCFSCLILGLPPGISIHSFICSFISKLWTQSVTSNNLGSSMNIYIAYCDK